MLDLNEIKLYLFMRTFLSLIQFDDKLILLLLILKWLNNLYSKS